MYMFGLTILSTAYMSYFHLKQTKQLQTHVQLVVGLFVTCSYYSVYM